MKILVLLVFIPSLLATDILCPNSKTTCPEDKQCCEVDGVYSCCDPKDEEIPDRKIKVFPGDELKSPVKMEDAMLSANHSKLQYCDISICPGTCCSDGCCSYSFATCCGSDACCPTLNTCCGRYCCKSMDKCCVGGCCRALEKCCGDGCCDYDAACCGTWCCKRGYKCGPRPHSCRSKGIVLSSNVVALLFMTACVFIYRHI